MRSDIPADATIGRDGMRAARALRDEGEGCAMRASLREIPSVTTDATRQVAGPTCVPRCSVTT